MEYNITMEAIIGLCNIIVTLIFGFLAKKFNWIESKYIPVQNLAIGLLAGILSYLVGLTDNIIISVVSCLIGSMAAGGIYDTSKTRKED